MLRGKPSDPSGMRDNKYLLQGLDISLHHLEPIITPLYDNNFHILNYVHFMSKTHKCKNQKMINRKMCNFLCLLQNPATLRKYKEILKDDFVLWFLYSRPKCTMCSWLPPGDGSYHLCYLCVLTLSFCRNQWTRIMLVMINVNGICNSLCKIFISTRYSF